MRQGQGEKMRTISNVLWLFVVVACVAIAKPAAADWINLTGAENSPTIAEIYVRDDHVRVVLEIYIYDISSFIQLLPDEYFDDTDINRPSEKSRLNIFSNEDFIIQTGEGENLIAQVEILEPRLRIDRRGPFSFMRNPYTGKLATQPPEDKRVLYVELKYPFEKRPSEIVVTPPMDEKGFVENNIGFIAYHKSVPIIDFRYLSQSEKLILDWSDPWYTRFENPVLIRHHRYAMMTFLYVEPYEVRHDMLTRVKDLEQWMDLGLRGNEYIEIDEWESLKQRVGELLLNSNPVSIDGASVKPILDRIDFVTVSLQGIQIMTTPVRLELSSALLGVKIAYMTEGFPQEVTVDWELFTDNLQQVPATSVDPAGPFLSYVTPDDNVHKWVNYLIDYRIPDVEEVVVEKRRLGILLPLGTILCLFLIVTAIVLIVKKKLHTKGGWIEFGVVLALVAGAVFLFPHMKVPIYIPAGRRVNLVEEDAAVVLHGLLKNIYRAFDFREEDVVYDKLAMTVSGDLLGDIYLQNRKSLEVQRAGGVQAKVQSIEILDVAAQSSDKRTKALDLNASWTVLGTVGHWGHVHARKNQYEAIVTVEPVGGAWRITGLELIEEKRVDPYANADGN
jgi:hypothetical protein